MKKKMMVGDFGLFQEIDLIFFEHVFHKGAQQNIKTDNLTSPQHLSSQATVI